MADKYAVRNLRLCTKDCLCLYVCPSGATDTENSIIDVNKCIGCGVCARDCPAKVIQIIDKKAVIIVSKTIIIAYLYLRIYCIYKS